MWVWPKSGPKSEVIGENLISLISLVPAAWAPAGIMEFVSNSRELSLNQYYDDEDGDGGDSKPLKKLLNFL